jgi:hypothetical protein
MANKQIFPGYVLSVCIARALHERDPKFLATLRSTVLEMRKSQPQGEATWETLQAFHSALHDPEIFPRS